jgi:hypothetical protein
MAETVAAVSVPGTSSSLGSWRMTSSGQLCRDDADVDEETVLASGQTIPKHRCPKFGRPFAQLALAVVNVFTATTKPPTPFVSFVSSLFSSSRMIFHARQRLSEPTKFDQRNTEPCTLSTPAFHPDQQRIAFSSATALP